MNTSDDGNRKLFVVTMLLPIDALLSNSKTQNHPPLPFPHIRLGLAGAESARINQSKDSSACKWTEQNRTEQNRTEPIMCKPTTSDPGGPRSKSERRGGRGWPRLLYSLESLQAEPLLNEKPGKHIKHSPSASSRAPLRRSFALTVAVVVAGLSLVELAMRFFFESMQHWHPLLHDERNRQVLARHVGVDALSCALCSLLGWLAAQQSIPTFDLLRRSTAKAACDERLFTYHPAAFRCSLMFFAYQVKNLYDSYVWNDGVEFLFHHLFSLLTAWGSLYPGCGHLYVVFFFGVSEISTAVLCLLANFDDQHGVIGLGQAFPVVKVVLGGLFVTLFILCRCILWPIFSYHFGRDVLMVLKHHAHDPRTQQRRTWMKFFLVSLAGLSVLQVAWLGQIVVMANQELRALGFI